MGAGVIQRYVVKNAVFDFAAAVKGDKHRHKAKAKEQEAKLREPRDFDKD